MIKIEALTLEDAFKDAAAQLECSVTEINIEVVQVPSNGFMGLFKKKAIIVATKKLLPENKAEELSSQEAARVVENELLEEEEEILEEAEVATAQQTILNDTIMPSSFVNDQDEEDDLGSGLEYTADYDDEYDEENLIAADIDTIAKEVETELNRLFASICFAIDTIEVSAYDSETLLVEFNGEDAALLIGKEGYRYKALSYMLFNWINAKYSLGLRLEIAEFLKNQEESVDRYLQSVYESIERDGKAQTKILDGVLVQIALKDLREKYPEKYVVIRTTRDGLKYIIINDYHH